MSKNKELDIGSNIQVPVPEGTESGDPVLLGDQGLCGVAETGRNSDGNATVVMPPSAVYRIPVEGKGKEANQVIDQFDKVFIDGEVVNADATNGTFFGWVLDKVASGKTETVRVKLACAPK